MRTPYLTFCFFGMILAAGCGDSGDVPPTSGGDADAFPNVPETGPFGDFGTPLFDAGISDANRDDDDVGFFDGGPQDAEPDGGQTDPSSVLNLTFEGPCAPDFGGDRTVAFAGVLSISAVRQGLLQAVLQFDLASASGAQIISTRNRLETGLAINLITSTTWTNASSDPAVIAGDAPDPVGGTLLIGEYAPETGVSDLTLVNVSLVEPTTDAVCTINGTVTTTRLGD